MISITRSGCLRHVTEILWGGRLLLGNGRTPEYHHASLNFLREISLCGVHDYLLDLP